MFGVVALALGVAVAFGSDLRLALFSAAVMLAAYAVLTAATSWVQPAFLLLVPGTVGLVALAAEDTTGLTTAVSTFLSLCIGIKIGALVTTGPARREPTR